MISIIFLARYFFSFKLIDANITDERNMSDVIFKAVFDENIGMFSRICRMPVTKAIMNSIKLILSGFILVLRFFYI